MNKIMNLLRYVPKRFVPVLAIVAAAAIPAALLAWGPSRATFTMENPASYITFNSITNNSEVGDERNFMVIKDAANTNAGGWQDTMNAVPGKEYIVRVYVHNDAAKNLNLVAQNTRVKVNVPTTTGKKVVLNGFVSADNANPKEVWDEAELVSNSDFNIAYVAGSARLENNHFKKPGVQLSDSIVTAAGAPVGFDKLDGKLPGCLEFAGYVTFKIKVQGPQTPKYDFQKQVRKSGSTDKYAENVSVNPGDKVDFRLSFTNTGDSKLSDVVIKDQLPAGMSYLANSAKLYNSNYPNGYQLPATLLTSGVNIGHYGPNINAFVVFTAQVDSNDKLPKCGVNNLKNIAKAETYYGDKEDDASVDVTKKCEEPKVPKYSCTGLTVGEISRTQFKFTGTSSVENATLVKYTFVVRDEAGKELARVDDTDGVYEYTQSNVGKYTVETIVTVKVDGVEKTTTNANCKKPFEVKEQPPKNEYACDSLTLIKKSRDTFEFTVKPMTAGKVTVKEYNFVFGDGQNQIVGAGTQTVSHTYKQPGDYTATVSVTFDVDGKTVPNVTSEKCKVKVTVDKEPPVECKPGVPVGSPLCEEQKECKPGIPVGDARCEEQPETPGTPSELPSTGPGAVIGGLFGSSALGLGVHSWLASRRALRDAMNK